MNISPQSGLEPKESARELLLIPEFPLSSQQHPAVHMKQSSSSPLSQHREYGMHTKASSLEHRKNEPSSEGIMNKYTTSAAHPKPARNMYRLEMPKLNIPLRNTNTVSGDIMPPPLQISALPKLPSLRNRGHSLTQTTIAPIPVQISTQISSSMMQNQTPPPTLPTRHVQCDKLSPLPVCSAQSLTPISNHLPATMLVTKQIKSQNLQPRSHNPLFRFKVPKGPVTSQVSAPGIETVFNQPLDETQPVDKLSSSSSNCSVQYNVNPNSQTTIVGYSADSNMDWSSTVPVTQSSPDGTYSNLISSDPVYHEVIAMPSSVPQMDQAKVVMTSSRDDNIQFQDAVMVGSRDDDIQFQEISCNSSVDHATVGYNVNSSELGDIFDANQSLLQSDGRNAQEFSNQQSMVYMF